ncbi:MAG: glutamate-1-semialdehyde-2,1-aminomutase [Deltaproteobacteria bacterium]|nr:MAG: glutamate-1-semialdehyde-2,1-aminomutase [Deltaproteobacteria bacterium]
MVRERSEALYERACALMPGGVNSPVRAFRGVGGTPVFVRRASGALIEDEDGHSYIDYVASWGPMILGHAHPEVIAAVVDAAAGGTSFGAPTARENVFAERIIAMVPSVEKVRLVNSGTEATLSAIRLARGFTGRPKLLKFEGCYHGHGDSLLVDAGSGVATLGIPGTPGVLPEVARNTITLPFNDEGALEEAFARHGAELAAAIIEPVAGNMGCVPPRPGYLEALRRLCTVHGAVLIFDEVMTGFRVAPGGVQERVGVTPDLTTLGKIVGGGLPLAAYGGRRDIMDHIAPAGPVYQAGTLSGNPLAVAAGLRTLELLGEDPGLYVRLEETSSRLFRGLTEAAVEVGVSVTGHQVGAMFSLYFSDAEVWSFADAKASRTDLYATFFHGMLDRGVYLAPSAFEALFPGAAHTDAHVDRTIAAAREAFGDVLRAASAAG